MSVSVRVDGLMVLTTAAVVGGGVLYSQREKIAEAVKGAVNKINPAHSDNFVNQAVERIAIKGERGGYTYDEHLFAAIDLLNPFYHGRNDYAKKVWGFGSDS